MKKIASRYSSLIYLLLIGSSFLLFHFIFFTTGFPMSHDGTHHLIRSAHYFQLLKESQFLPYWDGYMNSGFGSPLFNYVPPLVYLISSVFQALNLSVIDSLKVVVILFNILFFFGSYKALKLFFTTQVAFFATLVLFFSPYRISQVFVRGALPEFAALSLAPLFLFFLFKSFKVKYISINMLLAVILLHFIFLAHTLFAVQLCLGLGALLLGLLLQHKFVQSIQLLVVIGTAFLLSAFLYLPILFELRYVQIFLTEAFPPQHHFVAWWQLFDPGWGLGFSMPGTAEDGMSFQLGAFHWLLIALAGLFLVKDGYKKSIVTTRYIQIAMFTALLVSLFLQISSPVTRYLYEHVSIFHRQQFPWRFLNLSILFATYLGATALERFKLTPQKIIIGASLLFLLSSYYLRPGVFLHLTDEELLTYQSDTTFSHEYTPIGRDSTAEKEYVMTDRAYVTDGEASVTDLESTASTITFAVRTISSSATVRINTMFFPGVHMTLDSLPHPFTVLTKKDVHPVEDRDVTNLLQTIVPSGEHSLRIAYEPTYWRKLGSAVSITSYFTFLLAWIYLSKTRPKPIKKVDHVI